MELSFWTRVIHYIHTAGSCCKKVKKRDSGHLVAMKQTAGEMLFASSSTLCVCVCCVLSVMKRRRTSCLFKVERTQEIVSRKRWTETYNSFSAPIWCIERKKNQIYRKRFILVAKEKTGHTSRKSRGHVAAVKSQPPFFFERLSTCSCVEISMQDRERDERLFKIENRQNDSYFTYDRH